jgi:hypothetical protein
MEPTSDQPRANSGQRRILDFAGRGNWRLVAYRRPGSEWVYEIIELSVRSGEEPRSIMIVTPKMVKNLVDAGWIERAGRIRYRNGWWYRVTETGRYA